MHPTPIDLHQELMTVLLRALRYPSAFNAEQLKAMQALFALLAKAEATPTLQ